MALRWIRSLLPGEQGDGEGLNLAVAAPEALRAAEVLATPAAPVSPAEPVRRDTVEAHLAAKVLGAHLANRYQTSYPLTLNLASLGDEEGRAVMRLLADALGAEGEGAGERVDESCARLERLGATAEQIAALRLGLAEPAPLGQLVQAVRRFDKAPHAYALMLLSGVGRGTTGAAYLAYLALRLGLTRETVGSLSRRFRG